MATKKIEMIKNALKYAEKGIAVFPIIEKTKKPYTPNGCKDAKTDLRAIRFWWKKWPDANIAIATGSASGGLVVIDIDLKDEVNGYKALEEWQKENGQFPETARALSGNKGMHLYFWVDRKIGNRAGILPGVDVRGEGGYIIAPPSIHPNGNPYTWIEDPEKVPIAKADDVVYKFLEMRNHETKLDANGMPTKNFVIPQEKISAGSRNDTIFRFASSLQSQGLADSVIRSSVHALNDAQCQPPLEKHEVDIIIDQALKYQKGEIKEIKKNAQEKRAPSIATDEKGRPYQTIKNMEEAIEFDDDLWGRIKYNTLTYSICVFGNLPWRVHKGIRDWDNNDDTNLKSYIELHYGFKDMTRLMDALSNVANRYRYNPVIEFLEECEKNWDGNPYIKMLLPALLGAPDTEYTYECMKLFMLGAIKRAFQPGCKFDYMLVLIGSQGIGKSTFIRALACKDDWYNDNFNTIEGDKAAEKLRGMWMVEMAELLATKKAKDVEAIKAFITSQIDSYRAPYARRTEQRPRMCVFAGTTNNEHFLTDRTGNRRYLPIRTNADNVKISMFDERLDLKSTFMQAWGEAMNLYKQNTKVKLVLPPELQKVALEIQKQFLEEDPRIGMIQQWLDKCQKERVCVSMLYNEALEEYGSPDRRTTNQLHEIMMTAIEGWERTDAKKKIDEKYGVQICYVRKKSDGFVDASTSELPFK